MKKILILLSLLFCGLAHADTIDINWRVGDSVYDTSTCTVGGDLNVPTPPTKYGYTFRGWKPQYTRIEYIESTGTQYIDTGYNSNQDTTLDIVYHGYGCPVGSRWSNSVYTFGVWHEHDGRGNLYYNGTRYRNISVTGKKRVTITPEQIYINDGFILNYTHDTWQSPQSIYLFGWNIDGTLGIPFSGKIYQVALYDGNTLVRDFVPVLDTNDVPCMYDTVSATCFYNAGTGNFIAGPVVGSE